MTGREREALDGLYALAQRMSEAAQVYEDLWASEYARAILRERPDLQALDENAAREVFAEFAGDLTPEQKVCAALALVREAGLAKREASALQTAPAREEYACVESRFSPVISQFFGENANFFRASGFEDACERAADGSSDACLLPTHDGEGRAIVRTEKLCAEYGLKKRLSLVCEVGDERATYGLFARELIFCERPDFAEFSVPGGEENASIPALLCEKTGFTPWLSTRGGRITVQAAPKTAESFLELLACARLLIDGASLDAMGSALSAIRNPQF